ncbi:MAG TPA: leucyl/phenylalanyl-tRNA--protein transferase [Spongiibacteraceae bacterium]|jgi:leucyl/phenylalanyl-tRNA--protein transferase
MSLTLPRLDWDNLGFPAVEQALEEPNGLLAFGGDLRPERILAAYRRGIFPWYQDDQPILWWSPDPRAVLFPEQIHISRSMRKVLNSNAFDVRMDTDFAGVMRGCAEITAARTGTWITPAMQRAYDELHNMGHAHCIEVWQNEHLVGGLYGIALGAVFYGESMFSRVENASKVALIELCQQLQRWGFAVIDCQVSNGHLRSMGACTIERSAFLQLLDQHVDRALSIDNSVWQFDGLEQ